MRLASYEANGKSAVGLVVGDGVVDLSARLGVGDLRALLASEATMASAAKLGAGACDHALKDVTLLPPLPAGAKILCIGLNYEKHRVETNSPKSDFPQVFGRFADSVVGHGQAIWRPHISDTFDFEGELAVIVGKPGRYISEQCALDHVVGYACFNDGSIREWQRHTPQAVPGKNFFRSGAYGPWVTTADEVGDPHTLQLTTRLNGNVVQQDTTDSLLFSVQRLVNYCSSVTPLAPGDIIATGTPSGVGARRTPPLFMKPGDVVEVEISRVGLLRNPVEQEPASVASP